MSFSFRHLNVKQHCSSRIGVAAAAIRKHLMHDALGDRPHNDKRLALALLTLRRYAHLPSVRKYLRAVLNHMAARKALVAERGGKSIGTLVYEHITGPMADYSITDLVDAAERDIDDLEQPLRAHDVDEVLKSIGIIRRLPARRSPRARRSHRLAARRAVAAGGTDGDGPPSPPRSRAAGGAA